MLDASLANKAYDRSPCFPALLALCVGIACDHACSLPQLGLFATGGSLLLASAFILRDQRSWRIAAALALLAIMGAASHHAAWNARGPDSIARYLRDEPQLVRLRGIVESHPIVERRRDAGRKAAWPIDDRTRMTIACTSIGSAHSSADRPVTGGVQLSAAGHVVGVSVGDRIEVVGWLQKPGRARNPGGFDVERFLRLKGIDASLHADHPEAVRRLAKGGVHPLRVVSYVREQIGFRFTQHLSAENAAVGAAMILGDRSAIPIATRDAYVATGAMHVLSISGLHVGILAACLTFVLRLTPLSPTASIVLVTGIIWLYTALTDFGPPVLRASIFCTIWAAAALQLRRGSLLNIVSATAVMLLVWNPLLLFDVGARLSFLAILGMAWSLRMFPSASRVGMRDEDRFGIWTVLRPVLAAQVLGLGIWLFTAPVVAAEFDIVSPVGFLLNVVLLPLATVVLWSGYAFFAACVFAPALAGVLGSLFDAGLSCVNWLVETAAAWDLGHLSLLGPPTWWLVGFYVLLFGGLLRPAWAGRKLRGHSLLMVWCIAGLVVPSQTAQSERCPLEILVLDVGHGGAILIDAEDGPCLLFDCGSMEDDLRVADAVWSTLHGRSRTALNAVIVSHADLDHCNNVPALLEGGPVGAVLVGRSFLSFDQPVVHESVDAARLSGVPIRLVAAGDRLKIHPQITARLLHPPDRPPGDDNANSIVLELAFAGRSLLLTGDLEGSGQDEVFSQLPNTSFDVVTAPHHGGLKANTPRFAEWARPRAVIVSCGDRVNAEALEQIYAESDLYLTSRSGSLTIAVGSDGTLTVENSSDHRQPVPAAKRAVRSR